MSKRREEIAALQHAAWYSYTPSPEVVQRDAFYADLRNAVMPDQPPYFEPGSQGHGIGKVAVDKADQKHNLYPSQPPLAPLESPTRIVE